MKRVIIASLFLCIVCLSVIACPLQAIADVTDKQWKEMLVAVGDENWKLAGKLSSQYLSELDNADERLPRLRYIYLYSAAGEVSQGLMTFDDLDKIGKDLIGKEIVLPYREISREAKGASLNIISSPDSSNEKLFVTATNKTGTTIHSFEYINLKDKFDVAKHDGETASISGVIDSIKPNPNRSRAIVMRIYISQGAVKLKG